MVDLDSRFGVFSFQRIDALSIIKTFFIGIPDLQTFISIYVSLIFFLFGFYCLLYFNFKIQLKIS